MILKDAIESGLPFKRKAWAASWITVLDAQPIMNGLRYEFSIDELCAIDWETDVPKFDLEFTVQDERTPMSVRKFLEQAEGRLVRLRMEVL